MKKFQITADPNQDIGVSVGQSFIAFEGVHDVDKSPISEKRRFVINLTPDDILWTIEALAKELPEVLHDEAIAKIQSISEARACENCEFEPAEVGSKFCEICG